MASKIPRREEYSNLLDEYFWQYYRLNKTVKPKEYNTPIKCYKGAREIFKTLQEMLSESTHGILLKDFGAIVPKDSLMEVNKGIFKKEYKVRNNYLFFFEKEWLSEYYRTYITINKSYKNEDSNIIREPKYYAIKLHRKKIRKD